MGEAMFAGRRFRLDPTSISWNYSLKASDTPTLGGKVVQVFGTKISDLTVEGSFGVGGWVQQDEFLSEMKKIGTDQARYENVTATPQRFIYPPRGWDFLVYLKQYASREGGRRAVVLTNENINPTWRLVLHIVEENAGLKTVAHNSYIARLSKGLGYKDHGFHGPEVGDITTGFETGGSIGGQSPVGVTDDGTGGTSGNRGMGNQTSDVARWRPMVRQHFPPGAVETMMCLMRYESGGNPNAKNPNSTAMGLFQIMASVWEDSLARVGILDYREQLYDPVVNMKAAAHVLERQGYTAWAPYNRGLCRGL